MWLSGISRLGKISSSISLLIWYLYRSRWRATSKVLVQKEWNYRLFNNEFTMWFLVIENTYRPVIVVDIIILAGKLEKNQKEFLKLLQWFVSYPTYQFHIVIFCYFFAKFSCLHGTITSFAQCASSKIYLAVKSKKNEDCFAWKNCEQNSSRQ